MVVIRTPAGADLVMASSIWLRYDGSRSLAQRPAAVLSESRRSVIGGPFAGRRRPGPSGRQLAAPLCAALVVSVQQLRRSFCQAGTKAAGAGSTGQKKEGPDLQWSGPSPRILPGVRAAIAGKTSHIPIRPWPLAAVAACFGLSPIWCRYPVCGRCALEDLGITLLVGSTRTPWPVTLAAHIRLPIRPA